VSPTVASSRSVRGHDSPFTVTANLGGWRVATVGVEHHAVDDEDPIRRRRHCRRIDDDGAA
jgi:hypothetical protein